MAKKLVYFVRHGETEANSLGVRQGPEGHLTEKGRAQALDTAKRFPKHRGRPEVIISSPYERARDTAEIIGAELNMPIEYNDMLVERRNPSEIIGHSGEEPEVKKIVDIIDKSFHEDSLRYSDEENFVDLKERAKKLLEYIARRPEQQIILVTHSIFLRMVVAYMIMGEHLTAFKYNQLSYFNPIDNAGMCICSYEKRWLLDPEWKVLVWNDLTQTENS